MGYGEELRHFNEFIDRFSDPEPAYMRGGGMMPEDDESEEYSDNSGAEALDNQMSETTNMMNNFSEIENENNMMNGGF